MRTTGYIDWMCQILVCSWWLDRAHRNADQNLKCLWRYRAFYDLVFQMNSGMVRLCYAFAFLARFSVTMWHYVMVGFHIQKQSMLQSFGAMLGPAVFAGTENQLRASQRCGFSMVSQFSQLRNASRGHCTLGVARCEVPRC